MNRGEQLTAGYKKVSVLDKDSVGKDVPLKHRYRKQKLFQIIFTR